MAFIIVRHSRKKKVRMLKPRAREQLHCPILALPLNWQIISFSEDDLEVSFVEISVLIAMAIVSSP